MDPLLPLYELFDELNVKSKPPLQDEQLPLETPNGDPETHPVSQQKKEVDRYRKQGMSPQEAHMKVYGEVDTSDVDSKAQFSSTLGRAQSEKDKRGVKSEKESNSIFAQELEFEADSEPTPEDLKTPVRKEIPHELDKTEEYDYNEDVMYLRTYGRA